jgi:hypothetical protein
MAQAKGPRAQKQKEQQRREMATEADTSGKPDKDWDDVAEASWESFPASDPPSFTMRRPKKEPDGEPRDKK